MLSLLKTYFTILTNHEALKQLTISTFNNSKIMKKYYFFSLSL